MMKKKEKIQIDDQHTQSIAELACLELSAEETSLFTKQLSQILSYVEKIESVSVSGVEPLYHPLEDETLTLREDEIEPFLERDLLLQCAPETLYDGFKVPPML